MSRVVGARSQGFTLIELVVVMGILSGFLVMLVSLVDSGLTMFRDGETSQVLADRGARAQQVVRDELSRQEGDDDALLELRAGWFLPGQRIPSGPDRFVDPFDVVVPGGEELPGITVYEMTRPILSDLLHVEFGLWSQRTTSWGDARGPLHGFQSGATARLDDIHPHAILCRVVVAQDRDAAPEGLLARFLGADDTTLYLYDGAGFPGARDGGYVKLGGEWIRYASLEGDRLLGCKRGQRATKILEHATGTVVNVGRTVEFVVPVLHAKDDWNG
jgi:prepilin-type N-terminal cleavage/methylation domain-containing protein